jgi:hypothetical protein
VLGGTGSRWAIYRTPSLACPPKPRRPTGGPSRPLVTALCCAAAPQGPPADHSLGAHAPPVCSGVEPLLSVRPTGGGRDLPFSQAALENQGNPLDINLLLLVCVASPCVTLGLPRAGACTPAASELQTALGAARLRTPCSSCTQSTAAVVINWLAFPTGRRTRCHRSRVPLESKPELTPPHLPAPASETGLKSVVTCTTGRHPSMRRGWCDAPALTSSQAASPGSSSRCFNQASSRASARFRAVDHASSRTAGS